MSEFVRSRTMPALPEVVFDQACDLGRLDSWLPRDLHVHPDSPPGVTVHEDRTGEDAAALVRVDKEELRMEWGTRETGRYTGWLQIAGAGGGTTEVTVHLTFFDEAHAPSDSAVEQALEQSLDRLAEEVRLRADAPEGPG
ncbi:SRPBCC family protein [Streptomyces sp. NPDC049577]|uniref:SRPBCC family protein n=1 Tax=Streptomyces sp. NPDC049577 TaxID=3155153 RepID=UPI0034145999